MEYLKYTLFRSRHSLKITFPPVAIGSAIISNSVKNDSGITGDKSIRTIATYIQVKTTEALGLLS